MRSKMTARVQPRRIFRPFARGDAVGFCGCSGGCGSTALARPMNATPAAQLAHRYMRRRFADPCECRFYHDAVRATGQPVLEV